MQPQPQLRPVHTPLPLPHGAALVCAAGSVLNFCGDAMVNAANETMEGGGHVDGAVGASRAFA